MRRGLGAPAGAERPGTEISSPPAGTWEASAGPCVCPAIDRCRAPAPADGPRGRALPSLAAAGIRHYEPGAAPSVPRDSDERHRVRRRRRDDPRPRPPIHARTASPPLRTKRLKVVAATRRGRDAGPHRPRQSRPPAGSGRRHAGAFDPRSPWRVPGALSISRLTTRRRRSSRSPRSASGRPRSRSAGRGGPRSARPRRCAMSPPTSPVASGRRGRVGSARARRRRSATRRRQPVRGPQRRLTISGPPHGRSLERGRQQLEVGEDAASGVRSRARRRRRIALASASPIFRSEGRRRASGACPRGLRPGWPTSSSASARGRLPGRRYLVRGSPCGGSARSSGASSLRRSASPASSGEEGRAEARRGERSRGGRSSSRAVFRRACTCRYRRRRPVLQLRQGDGETRTSPTGGAVEAGASADRYGAGAGFGRAPRVAVDLAPPSFARMTKSPRSGWIVAGRTASASVRVEDVISEARVAPR